MKSFIRIYEPFCQDTGEGGFYISDVEENSYQDRIEPWKLMALSVRIGVHFPLVRSGANHGNPVYDNLWQTCP